MIQQQLAPLEEAIEHSRAACAALSDEEDNLKRETLAHAGNRWSLGIVHALGVARGPLRHAELGRALDGITQRMLTRALDAEGKQGWFGIVNIKKSYVAFHLMPLYERQGVLDALEEPPAGRRHGKTCFN